jgi:tRNA-dihydrouridine synthase B
VARSLVSAVGDLVPVTAKIRTGWDQHSINAVEVARILEGEGISVITVHGRTKSQGYSGAADWEVIDAVARSVTIPVIGNGDLTSGAVIRKRLSETAVRGVMVGRAAMQSPWIFQEARHFLETGTTPPPPSAEEKWQLMLRHSRMALAWGRYGNERQTMQAMRTRLMHYTKGLPSGRHLRQSLTQVSSLMELEDIATSHLSGPKEAEPVLLSH